MSASRKSSWTKTRLAALAPAQVSSAYQIGWEGEAGNEDGERELWVRAKPLRYDLAIAVCMGGWLPGRRSPSWWPLR